MYQALQVIVAGVIAWAPDLVNAIIKTFTTTFEAAGTTVDISLFVAQHISVYTITAFVVVCGVVAMNLEEIRASVRTFLAAYEEVIMRMRYHLYMAISLVSSAPVYVPALAVLVYEGSIIRAVVYVVFTANLRKLAIVVNPHKVTRPPVTVQTLYANIDGKFIPVETAPAAINEMATQVTVTKRPRLKHEVILTTTTNTFLGQATLVNRGAASYLVTALHVIDGEKQLVAVAGDHALKIDLNDFEHVMDVAVIPVDNNFCSRLGLKAVAIAQLDLSTVVKTAYSMDSKNWRESMGGIPKPTAPGDAGHAKYTYTHSSSTEAGASGAGVFQNGKFVGVHCGSVPNKGLNRFQSFIHFLLQVRSKRSKLAIHAPYTESSVSTGSLEEFMDDDIEDFITSRFTNKHYDDDEAQELHELLREKRVFEELRSELMDLHLQGYGVNSAEVKSTTKKHRARLTHESAKIKQIRITYSFVTDEEEDTFTADLNSARPVPGSAVNYRSTISTSSGPVQESSRQSQTTTGKLSSTLLTTPQTQQSQKLFENSSGAVAHQQMTFPGSIPMDSCVQLLSQQMKVMQEQLQELVRQQNAQSAAPQNQSSSTKPDNQTGGTTTSNPIPASTTQQQQGKRKAKSSSVTSTDKQQGQVA
jgi:hypothetical protein